MTCACGHAIDEHEPDCQAEDCDCVHYEALDDEED